VRVRFACAGRINEGLVSRIYPFSIWDAGNKPIDHSDKAGFQIVSRKKISHCEGESCFEAGMSGMRCDDATGSDVDDMAAGSALYCDVCGVAGMRPRGDGQIMT